MDQSELFQTGISKFIALDKQRAAGIKERARLKTRRIEIAAEEMVSGKVSESMVAESAEINSKLLTSVQESVDLSKKISSLSFYLSAFGVVLQVEANLQTLDYLAAPARKVKDCVVSILKNIDKMPDLSNPSDDDEFSMDVIDLANIGMPQFNELVEKIKKT